MAYLEELLRESKRKAAKPAKKRAEEPAAKVEEEEARPEVVEEGKTLVASYDNVKVYKVPGDPLLLYQIPVPHLDPQKATVINTVREIATKVITIDPLSIKDMDRRYNVFYEKVSDIIDSSPELGVPVHDRELFIKAVVQDMIGYGILDPFIRDDNLEEVMVIGANKPVYVFHRQYEMMKTNAVFHTDEGIGEIIDKIARQVGRRIDMQNPLLDARLPDGTRVNATIPPASIEGPTVTIRKFKREPLTVIDLVANKTITAELAAFLWTCVDGMGAKPANILIAGGTASGKTSTLNVLSMFIPSRERIVTIEDTGELNLPLEHWVRLEARPPGLEGTGEITLDMLMKNALRMRPDRIIVGEVRRDEAYTMFVALNTGHDGGMGTVHANSAPETIVRLTEPPMNVPRIMLSALNFIVVQHKIFDRRKGTIRRVTEVAEVMGTMEKPTLQPVFAWDPAADKLTRTDNIIQYIQTLQRYTGLDKRDIEAEIKDRQKVLERLLADGKHDMASVSKAIQDYYMRKRAA